MESQAGMVQTPTSRSNSRWIEARQGYSILEMVIVLALMTISAAIIMPRAGAALDQVVVHTLQFDLQRQVSNLRRSAYLEQQGYEVVIEGQTLAQQDAGSSFKLVELKLPRGWNATYMPSLKFLTNGTCLAGRIQVRSLGKTPIVMRVSEDCQLVRYREDAVQP